MKDDKTVVMDRALFTHDGKEYAVWAILSEQKRLIIVQGNNLKNVLVGVALTEIRQVRGMGTRLNFFVADRRRPISLKLLPVSQDPDQLNRPFPRGLTGSLYREDLTIKGANVMLWVNLLKENGVPVRYWKTNVVFVVVLFGGLAGIVLLAGLSFVFSILFGILMGLFHT